MAKFFAFAAAAAVLVASTAAHEGHSAEAAVTKECAANVTTAALAVIDNSTYLNSCSPGSTWKLTNLFEAANLSAADFLTFCQADNCMDPMHELLEVLPSDCYSTYKGEKVVFEEKVDAIHDKCHSLLNKESGESEGSHHHDGSSHEEEETVADGKSNSTASSAVPASTPAPAKSSASVSSKSLAALISVTSAVVALVL